MTAPMDNALTRVWMRAALALADEAAQGGDVPVGAIVLDAHGAIVGRGRNMRERDADPLAHAEILAMREAAAARGDWNLDDCTLVVTLEPCPMCAGACLQTHIGRIVFGAWDAKLGACGSVWDIPRDPHVGHVPEIVGGVLERACAGRLAAFFRTRRAS
ncbi:tRNA adenosine(34) deaminase TadA [Bifidobacterium criceti]|uniref:tRNA-specific adenosine deaminase n=2 Tax=Bifidobacterium TaxID=1678 RepID=A0A2A2EJI9_9BIFI|nr:cytidine and deoxycytidylate deaminase [Bifidobacterium criceti]